MPLHGIRLHVLAFALLAGGCGGGSGIASPPAAAVALAGDAGLSPADEIDGLDLARDSGAGLHLVWRERLGVYGGTRGGERIVYRRGDGTPLRWGPRIVITDQAPGRARVVATADGVHVFAGHRLRHWRLPAGGGGVQDLGDLLDGSGPGAEMFDAIAARERIAIVFSAGGPRSDATLHGVTWAPQGSTPPRPVAAAAPAGRAGFAMPELHGLDGRLLALWTEVADAWAPVRGTDIVAVSDRTRVRSAWSENAGVSWTDAGEVAPGPAASSVSALAGAAGPLAFFASHGVYASRWTGRAWSAPVRISGEQWREFPGIADVSALAATGCAGRPVLAWADARHRRSDRRWWNPLGGFPWSDSPDWADNDLFVVTRGLADAVREAAMLRPRRLSAAGSFTGEIAIAALDGGLVVVRAGRAHVRKGRSDGGAPPEVTQLQVPCG